MTNDQNFTITKDYYDSLAEEINNYFPQGYQVALIKDQNSHRKPLSEQNYNYLMGLVNVDKDDHILDIGCGNGQFFDYLQSHEDYRYLFYNGVDLSEKQINNAMEKFENSEGKFLCNPIEKVMFLTPTFNLCFFLESIGYMKDLDMIAKTMSHFLHLGGHVIIKNPIKVVEDVEADKEYCEKFKSISEEYGFSENSLGMIVDKKILEETFEKNGFQLTRFEIPEYDIEEYNKTFSKMESFSNKHPQYINHVFQKNGGRIENNSSKNKYYECGVFVFKKIENVIEHFSELPQINVSYTAGVEQSQIDPSHPNAPYMQSRSKIQYSKDTVNQEEGIQTTSITSKDVANTEDEMVIKLDITYENN